MNWPLQENFLDNQAINKLCRFIKTNTRFTQFKKVREFEQKFSKWNGSKYSIFVNSGSSANLLMIQCCKEIYSWKNNDEIIVPVVTWPTTVTPVSQSGLKPVFVDTNLDDYSFDYDDLKKKITKKTKAIFVAHLVGFPSNISKIKKIIGKRKIIILEDCCESQGAKINNKKVGNFGIAGSFSFYWGHHMSTIEGGMISTNDSKFYQLCRSLRSHGMVREFTDEKLIEKYKNENKDLSEDFIFIGPAHNFRSTEINAVLGLCQLPKLDSNNKIRVNNFKYFVEKLNSEKFYTDFEMDGQSNYAFIVIMKEADFKLRDKIENIMNENGIEFRRGLSGGGNQLRQPFFKNKLKEHELYKDFPNIEHVHNFSWYIGNYPTLEIEKIDNFIRIIN